MNYTGVEDHQWEPETFTLLLTVSMVEKLVFADYETRLQFDTELVQNRALATRPNLPVEDKSGAYSLTTPSGEEHQFAGIVDVARWATATAFE
jgi:hypothetical protein